MTSGFTCLLWQRGSALDLGLQYKPPAGALLQRPRPSRDQEANQVGAGTRVVVRFWHGRTSGSSHWPLMDGENDAWMRPPAQPYGAVSTLANAVASLTNPATVLHRRCQTVAAVITAKSAERRLQNLQFTNGSSEPTSWKTQPICPLSNDQFKSLTSRWRVATSRPAIAHHRLRADARGWPLPGRRSYTIPRWNHAGRMAERRKGDLLFTAGELSCASVFGGGKP